MRPAIGIERKHLMGSDTQLSTTSSDTNSAATAEGTMQAVVQDTYGSADVCTEERLGEKIVITV